MQTDAFSAGSEPLLRWVRRSAEIVARYYGRFPTPRLTLRVTAQSGDGVHGGKTFANPDAFIQVQLGRDVTDAQLLADVWLAMTRGQETLDMALVIESAASLNMTEAPLMAAVRVLRASVEDLAAHAAMCERIARESKAGCLWMRIAPAS